MKPLFTILLVAFALAAHTQTVDKIAAAIKAREDSTKMGNTALIRKAISDSLKALKTIEFVQEQPVGAVDSVNKVFQLSGKPIPGTLLFFVDGRLLNPKPAGTRRADYTLGATTNRVTTIMPALLFVLAVYQKYSQ